jgi:hypothetical protein
MRPCEGSVNEGVGGAVLMFISAKPEGDGANETSVAVGLSGLTDAMANIVETNTTNNTISPRVSVRLRLRLTDLEIMGIG